MRRRFAQVLACALLLAATNAGASDDKQAEQLVRDGVAAYEAGDFARAANTLERAYALAPLPRLLFNIARAHDKAGQLERALSYYERYLAGETEPDLADRARQAVDRLRPPPAASAAPPPASAAPPPAPVVAPATVRRAPISEAPPRAPTQAPSHTGSLVLVGLGATALLVGIGVGISASDAASRMHDSTDRVVKNDLRDTAQHRALAADVTMLVGLAVLATGVVVRLTSEDSTRRSREASSRSAR